jgi:hypothetical protein
LVIFSHAQIENGLREWARLVANASPTPPRVSSPPITGWCSWYNLYAYINEENILDHLHAAQTVATRENLPMRVFQIDDGFTPEMGDWLEVKPQFPRGMKPILDDIRSAGFISAGSPLHGRLPQPFVPGSPGLGRKTGRPAARWCVAPVRRVPLAQAQRSTSWTLPAKAFDYLRSVFPGAGNGAAVFQDHFMYFGSEYGAAGGMAHPGRAHRDLAGGSQMIREKSARRSGWAAAAVGAYRPGRCHPHWQ